MADLETELRALLAHAESAAPARPGMADRLIARAQREPRHRQWPSLLLRGAGQAMVTAGVLVLLFLGYEVYVTNFESHVQQVAVRHELVTDWKSAPSDPLVAVPGSRAPDPSDGKGLAILYIPRLGSDYSFAIVEGTSESDLTKGPGHYAGTALPGQVGNFAVAGHRVGKGEPFLNLDHLRRGDAVVVETDSRWYVYRVTGDEVVDPSDGAVIAPVADHPGQQPVRATMTMTTCHPKFTATHRLVVHAVLDTSVPAQGTAMPATIRALYEGIS